MAAKTKRVNYYPRAIEIVTAENGIPYKDICIALAKHYPATLVKVVGMLTGTTPVGRYLKYLAYELDTQATWYQEMVEEYKTGQKIPAIKALRNSTGMSLMAAKTFVETKL
jgi:predicted oxidoreductase